MKLSELRPCDFCGGPVGLCFRFIEVRVAVVRPDAARQVMGLSVAHGFPIGLAEEFAPEADRAVAHSEELTDKLFCCTECYCKPLDIARVIEKRNAHHAAEVQR